jgi:hypothetical protein
MAQSISLAVLENLVHTSKVDFPVGYVTVSALIPAELTILREKDINIDFPDAGPRELGDQWLASLGSAVLRVHSARVQLPVESEASRVRADYCRAADTLRL